MSELRKPGVSKVNQELFPGVTYGESGFGTMVSIPGPPGSSAYEIAIKNGYIGTEAEWLISLIGPKGDNGKDIELRTNTSKTYLQWRYKENPPVAWENLVELEILRGPQGDPGREIELQILNKDLLMRYTYVNSAGETIVTDWQVVFNFEDFYIQGRISEYISGYEYKIDNSFIDPVSHFLYSVRKDYTSVDINTDLNDGNIYLIGGGDGAQFHIVNNLTEGGTTKSLSAEQGKILNEKKYEKPVDGIPESDLSSDVQSLLNSAGTIGSEYTITGNNIDTDFQIVHTLNSINLNYKIYDSSNITTEMDFEIVNENTIKVSTVVPLGSGNNYKIVLWK